MENFIRFDWAIKKLLRDKANFVILEGFLTVVLNQEIKILQILESESNQEDENDKFNKVDLLVKNQHEELIIIELQNNKEYDYFQHMLYSTSRIITEHLDKGDQYVPKGCLAAQKVKKVYAITVAYFDLGEGDDYVYYGSTEFKGIHSRNPLSLSDKQMALFKQNSVKSLYPEYYIIKANKFDDEKVSDKLDELYFLKKSKIPDTFTAPGLKEAREVLAEMNMSASECRAYNAFNKRLHDIASANFTKEADLNFAIEEAREEGMEKGREEGKKEIALNLIKEGLDNLTISKATRLPIKQIEALRKP